KLGGCGLSKSGWLDRADRPEQQQRADCFQHRLEGAVRILQVGGGRGCDLRLVLVSRRRLTSGSRWSPLPAFPAGGLPPDLHSWGGCGVGLLTRICSSLVRSNSAWARARSWTSW